MSKVFIILAVCVWKLSCCFAVDQINQLDKNLKLDIQFINPVGLFEKVEERYAREEDIEGLLSLYANMSKDDIDSLIILPEKFRIAWFLDSIQKKRLFVSTYKSTIIGMVKAYLPSEEERDTILKNELRCLPSQELVNPELVNAGSYKLSKKAKDGELTTILFEEFSLLERKKNIENKSLFKDQTYIYYGSSYVKPEFRNFGLGAKLDKYAFLAIKNDVMHKTVSNNSKKLILMYGRVAKTVMHTGIMRSIGDLLFAHFSDLVELSMEYYAFKAHKPNFCLDENENLICNNISVDKWRDFGCILSFDLKI